MPCVGHGSVLAVAPCHPVDYAKLGHIQQNDSEGFVGGLDFIEVCRQQ